MTTEDSEQIKPTPSTDGERGPLSIVGRAFEWLFLDFPYLLFNPDGLVWRLLRNLGRGLLVLPRGLMAILWWLLRQFFGWQKPFWLWLAWVTGLTALGQVYIQLEKPARIIFWVPVLLVNALLQNIIGGLIPVLIVAILFIYFNKFVIRDEAQKQIDRLVGREPD